MRRALLLLITLELPQHRTVEVLATSAAPPATPAVASLSGRVVSAGSDAPLEDATVRIDGVPTEVRTNTVGEFVLPGAPVGVATFRTRRIGFYPGRGTVRITRSPGERVEIGLDPVLHCLDACDSPPTPTPGYVRVVR